MQKFERQKHAKTGHNNNENRTKHKQIQTNLTKAKKNKTTINLPPTYNNRLNPIAFHNTSISIMQRI